MTQANARYHLAHLEANGLVEVIDQQRGAGRGRPAMVYGLARHTLGDNLDGLADELLCERLSNLPVKKKGEYLHALAQRLATECSSSGMQNLPLTRRLAQTVERLNELHYEARWEAGAAGPRLILGHCPYARIIDSHTEICQVDALLLEEMLGLAVRQTAKLQVGERGLPFCEFMVVTGIGIR